VTKRYLHDGDQVIEEYNGAATPARQRYYVWGNYIDELLMMHNDDGGGGTDYYACHDQIYSPHALLSSTGSIVERYDYDAYGQPVIYTGDGGDGDWWDGDETASGTSAKGLVYFFTGRELDTLDSNALKLYYYRARTYHPTLGRFLQRDPIGYMLGIANRHTLTALYEAALNEAKKKSRTMHGKQEDDNPLVREYDDGMNLYQYVRSMPAYALDPSGLGCYSDCLKSFVDDAASGFATCMCIVGGASTVVTTGCVYYCARTGPGFVSCMETCLSGVGIGLGVGTAACTTGLAAQVGSGAVACGIACAIWGP
jgi:RHS repeat-associated protein